MDNQLLISWSFMVVVALVADIGAYIFLRFDWKKNGSTFIDRFWNAVFDKIEQFTAIVQKQIAIALLKYHPPAVSETNADVDAATLEGQSQPEAAPEPTGELVPVTVRNVGNVRRVKFTLDMALDTQVEVRIGATREAGVTVEKREL